MCQAIRACTIPSHSSLAFLPDHCPDVVLDLRWLLVLSEVSGRFPLGLVGTRLHLLSCILWKMYCSYCLVGSHDVDCVANSQFQSSSQKHHMRPSKEEL